ncbi:MAG: hypothetical protein U9Q76_00920, partial [candidate division WOR-3 bacterium]|nr:hypothetical protein [candidate division WOR-3 bacterium]
VLKKGTKQIRGDIDFFRSYRDMDFENLRDQTLEIDFDSVKTKHYVVIYNSRYPMPAECLAEKHHISLSTVKSVFIHLIHAYNWSFVCRYLVTPMEIIEYLDWRERFLNYYKDKPELKEKSEKWLVGRFVGSPKVPEPDYDDFHKDYEGWVDALEGRERENLKFKGIVQTLAPPNNIPQQFNREYHKTLLELALLDRTGRKAFIERYDLVGRKVLDGVYDCVYRFSEGTKVGFVFCPATSDLDERQRLNGLRHFTYAHKYEHKLNKCIGLYIYPGQNGKLLVDWHYTKERWEKSYEWDQVVKELYRKGIFLPLKKQRIPRYKFRDGQ